MFKKTVPTSDNARTKRRWGISSGMYKLFNVLLPVVVLMLVYSDLNELAVAVALFSKWRVFTVRPRHLITNLRANAVDIIVKLATISFIIQSSNSLYEQIVWTAWYIVWLTLIKPGSSLPMVSAQAMFAQVLGFSTLMYYSGSLFPPLTILLAFLMGSLSARHFLSFFEEKNGLLMSVIWGFFTLQLVWTLQKWTLVYVFIPQIVFILVVVSYTVGSIYTAYKQQTLKSSFARQQVIMAVLILLAIVLTGDWQGDI